MKQDLCYKFCYSYQNLSLINLSNPLDPTMDRNFLVMSFIIKLGIFHQTSCIATPQQHFLVERKHGDILNVTRSLLFHGKLPKYFGSYAVLHTVYLINTLPYLVLNNKSPFEILYEQPPTFLELKVFGSL